MKQDEILKIYKQKLKLYQNGKDFIKTNNLIYP